MSSQELAETDPADTSDAEPETGTSSSVAASSTPESACPVVDSLEQIGSRWRLVVLHELLNGESRFNELKRETDANARTLSRVLDDLQETGFVHRRLEEESPVATYYSLTDKGESLAPVFEEIDDWAHEWLAECSE
ncbi:helix-turn-helix domain-containing protein [Halorubrum sp. AD140]|uniref:winged helix-turn-helix transcriptional regulator n=1 Tax=Halorubrum sp. AD140 TaxID=3050073 RepID=UPI002ACC3BAF|nr:helix-turn-helix domain-containing protein [Halorubrum sp. AD140]MDZ5811200.1 helix-turn-helix domain-containing protein [Halorubrum sp. AD140]